MVFIFALLALALVLLFVGWRRVSLSFVIVALLFAVAVLWFHATDTLQIHL